MSAILFLIYNDLFVMTVKYSIVEITTKYYFQGEIDLMKRFLHSKIIIVLTATLIIICYADWVQNVQSD